MKKTLFGLFLLSSISAFSQSSSFHYTEGRLEGQVVEHIGDLDYGPVCYEGNPWRARTVLKEMAFDNIEIDNVKVWYNQINKNIEFTFVSTKCMDDSLDATEDGCRVEVEITKCN